MFCSDMLTYHSDVASGLEQQIKLTPNFLSSNSEWCFGVTNLHTYESTILPKEGTEQLSTCFQLWGFSYQDLLIERAIHFL
jgi:hypothetical protein